MQYIIIIVEIRLSNDSQTLNGIILQTVFLRLRLVLFSVSTPVHAAEYSERGFSRFLSLTLSLSLSPLRCR